MSRSGPRPENQGWPVSSITTSWDDLLEGIDSPYAWANRREAVRRRFLKLIHHEASPEHPPDPEIRVKDELSAGGFRIQYVSYQIEADERAHAYIAFPDKPVPGKGFPGVVCLHGTINWGARQTLGLPPLKGDPHADSGILGKDFALQLVRRGYVTISPEHFCAASRMPEEGPYHTAAFYRRHPRWSAAGKYIYDSHIACSVLSGLPEVDSGRLGVTGHSLGGHGSIWLAAYDDRIRCAAPSCSGSTFRENPSPLEWSREEWYVYFPLLREEFLAGRTVQCDFHEMMALIAPRPLLERFALNDVDQTSQQHRVMLHLKLHELYRLLGREQAHSFLVSGDGHSIPDLSGEAMLLWMDRWLKHDGNPMVRRKKFDIQWDPALE